MPSEVVTGSLINSISCITAGVWQRVKSITVQSRTINKTALLSELVECLYQCSHLFHVENCCLSSCFFHYFVMIVAQNVTVMFIR